ncbi:hypothetical protein PoB_002564700 [Plakobranchus ocellatus]|uniref:Uncharacterized protein n=1 Tax=Plakobranchus ocellatus TaxID=259542 RepID=A0AAV3ZX54_9GAST|nr:hypothetical protein PoB_002564700 [Plakobranchus ocellatus]
MSVSMNLQVDPWAAKCSIGGELYLSTLISSQAKLSQSSLGLAFARFSSPLPHLEIFRVQVRAHHLPWSGLKA